MGEKQTKQHSRLCFHVLRNYKADGVELQGGWGWSWGGGGGILGK